MRHMDTSALSRAMEKRMWHDLAQRLSVGKKARYIRGLMFDEAKSLPKGDSGDAILTPFQKGIRDDIKETVEALEALFDAFDRTLASDSVEDDPVSDATARLLGPLVGRLMALELRVAALEAALD